MDADSSNLNGLEEAPRARLCHLVKWANFDGYGFNLHAERANPGQFIGKIDDLSPAQLAGLREGDRIVEVNGVNIESESHRQVVERIKSRPNETSLLVVDSETDAWFKANSEEFKLSSSLPNIVITRTPLEQPKTSQDEPIAKNQSDCEPDSIELSPSNESNKNEQVQHQELINKKFNAISPPMTPDSGKGDDVECLQRAPTERVIEAEINEHRPASSASQTEFQSKLQNNNDVSDSGQSFMSSSSSSSDANSIDSLEDQSAVQHSAQCIVERALNESIEHTPTPINGITEVNQEAATKDNQVDENHEQKKDIQEAIKSYQIEDKQKQQAELVNKEVDMQQTEVKTVKQTANLADKQMEIKSLLTNHQTLAREKVDQQQEQQQIEQKQSDLEPDSLSSIDNSIKNNNNNNNNNNNYTAEKAISKPSLKQANNNNNIVEDQFGGLNLNMTASEMRELLSRRKKFDPKKAQMNIRQKYEIIQQM